MGRANYELPDETLMEVRELSGAKTKREAIVIALEEYIQMKKIQQLIQAQGTLPLNWTKRSLRKYRG